MTTFKDVLPDGLADRLSEVMVSALQHSYAINCERYNQELGDDGLTFGVQVWRNSWFQLEQAVDDLSGVTTARPDGSLVIRVGGVQIHTYKVGNTEGQSIHNVRISGTATKNRIVRSNVEQLQLFPTALTTDGPPNLVLAHAGNHFDGLCAVWIGAPTEDAAGPSWHWVESLHQIPRDEVRRDEPLPEGPVVPYSDLPVSDFDLTLKADMDEEQPSTDEPQ